MAVTLAQKWKVRKVEGEVRQGHVNWQGRGQGKRMLWRTTREGMMRCAPRGPISLLTRPQGTPTWQPPRTHANFILFLPSLGLSYRFPSSESTQDQALHCSAPPLLPMATVIHPPLIARAPHCVPPLHALHHPHALH